MINHNRDDPGAPRRNQGNRKRKTVAHHHQRHTEPNNTKETAAHTKNPEVTNKETTAHHHRHHMDPPGKAAQPPTDQKATTEAEAARGAQPPKHQEATKRTEAEADRKGTKHPLITEAELTGPEHHHQNTDEDAGAQHQTDTHGNDRTDTEAIDGKKTKNYNQHSGPYYQGPNVNRKE